MQFEYSAIPAPARSEKLKEVKTTGERYALTLTAELNRMAADGWEYIRADVLPSEERSGLTGRSTVYHNLLIFRRAVVHHGAKVESPVSTAAPVTPTAFDHTASSPSSKSTDVSTPATLPVVDKT